MAKTDNCFILYNILFLYCFYFVYSEGRFPEEELLNSLTTGRNPNARPSIDPLQAVNLSLTLSINSIVNVNEIDGTLTTRLTLQMKWFDFSLAWNISTFNGISQIQMMSSDIWTPDLIIYNSLTTSPLDKANSMVTVTNDGIVIWSPNFLLITSCTISVAKFPFDSQMCDIQIGPWFRDTRSQYVTSAIMNVMKFSGNNGVWDLTGKNYTSLTVAQLYQAHFFKLFLSRRPNYHILHMFCPVILLSFMNCFVFLLPNSSGEKISFCISIFLTFSVLLDSLKEALPATPLEMPYFGVFVFFQFCLGGIESCVSVLVLRLSCRSGTDKVPKYFGKICTVLKLISAKRYPSVVSPIDDSKLVHESHKENSDNATSDNYSSVKEDDSNKNSVQKNELTWDDVASGMDKFCFFLFTGISLTSYIVLFILLFS